MTEIIILRTQYGSQLGWEFYGSGVKVKAEAEADENLKKM